ncbi:MAG: diaminopimelate decarboxylase [Betaproteobacteria bacterium]|jgi:diaminopimelate decarboxylase|nr:diaminopimelate decarboxylase [Betaproteobacteria bacterium]MBK8690483.1 diaminopimelate decarboxylase [Betaproteobacteria bacterium]
MTPFRPVDGTLHAEDVALTAIAARFGTPCYVYSRAALEARYRQYADAFAGTPHLVCYAMKANSNLAVLDVFARLGCGFDIVSGGELARVLAAGGDPAKVVFSGVGKTESEMEAALAARILCFNVESAAELEVLNAVAGRLGATAPVSFRVNPDVDPRTHPYIATGLKESKFGVAFDDAPALYRHAATLPHVAVRGIDCHIGSQITDLPAYAEATARMLELVDGLEADGIRLDHVDLGGGIGIRYRDEVTIDPRDYARVVRGQFRDRPHKLLFEPGRFLVGDAGVLLTRVLYLKPGDGHHFAIVDAAMNDLIRPALYDAWHAVDAVRPRAGAARHWQIVGPICESGDFLARDRELVLAPGDLLAVRGAGAYGFAMSSNYNSRPRACEVMVDGARAHLIRPRETLADLFAHETRLP